MISNNPIAAYTTEEAKAYWQEWIEVELRQKATVGLSSSNQSGKDKAM